MNERSQTIIILSCICALTPLQWLCSVPCSPLLFNSASQFQQSINSNKQRKETNLESKENRRDEVSLRDGVFFEPEQEHGGSFPAQEAGLRRVFLRHWCPREAPGSLAPGAQCLRIRNPLQVYVR